MRLTHLTCTDNLQENVLLFNLNETRRETLVHLARRLQHDIQQRRRRLRLTPTALDALQFAERQRVRLEEDWAEALGVQLVLERRTQRP